MANGVYKKKEKRRQGGRYATYARKLLVATNILPLLGDNAHRDRAKPCFMVAVSSAVVLRDEVAVGHGIHFDDVVRSELVAPTRVVATSLWNLSQQVIDAVIQRRAVFKSILDRVLRVMHTLSGNNFHGWAVVE